MQSVSESEHSLVASVIFMYLEFFYLFIFSYEVFNIIFLEDIVLCLIKIKSPTLSTHIIGRCKIKFQHMQST